MQLTTAQEHAYDQAIAILTRPPIHAIYGKNCEGFYVACDPEENTTMRNKSIFQGVKELEEAG